LSLLCEAIAAALVGSADQAMTIAQRHLEWTTAHGAQWPRSWAQLILAAALTKHGDAEEALRLGHTALSCQLSCGDQWGPTWVVQVRTWSLARLIADQRAAGNTRRSALVKLASEIAYLAGGLRTQRDRLGVQIENLGPIAEETHIAEQVAREILGQRTYTDIEKRGATSFSGPSELQRLALGTDLMTTSFVDHPAAQGTSTWPTLSAAEQEVATLAAAGWPNSAIAARRGTSTRTTDAQMSSILEKLMIESREDIVRFIPEDQRSRVSAERSHIPRQTRDKPRRFHTPQG